LSERWLERAAAAGDLLGEAQAHARLAISLSAAGGRYAEARQHFAAATAIFSAHGNVSATAGELLSEALLETRLGFFDKARAATERAVVLFESIGDARGRLVGLANLGFLRTCDGDVAGAQQAARDAFTLAQELGFALIAASALENLSFAEAAAGDLTRAIADGEASVELRVGSESEVWSNKTLADLAVWHAALGNLDAARQCVRRMLADESAIAQSTEWPEYCYWAAAQIFRLDGDSERSSAMLERAHRAIRETAEMLDPEDRARFLAVPWHRDITEAVQANCWPNPPR